MSIVDEINKDLAELGETGGNTIEEAMDKLGDEVVKTKGEADANKLPEVTAEDEGNALIVDSEGKWAKAKINEAALKLKWTVKGNAYTTSLSGSELRNAVKEKVVEIYDEVNNRNYRFHTIKNNLELYFISAYPLNDHIELHIIIYNINNQNGTYQTKSINFAV